VTTAQAVASAEALVEARTEEVRGSLPRGSAVFDAHVHVGTDEDGASAPVEEVLAQLRDHRVRGAFAFSLNEPDRTGSFRAANDRTLAAAEQSGGVLVPFARLDLSADPCSEAERSFARGALGLKIHTRAQPLAGRERELERVFALAGDHRAPVLVHAGLGMPRVAELLCELAERTPDAILILAHGGIADLATFSERLAGRPGAFYDTAIWSPFDLLAVAAAVPPEQLLYGSDLPYGQLPDMLLLALRAAAVSGWTEEQVAAMLGANAARIAARRAGETPSRPVGLDSVRLGIGELRVHDYLAGAMRTLWSRRSRADELIALAEGACEGPGVDLAQRERAKALLAAARVLWLHAAGQPEDERRRLNRRVFQLLHLAEIELVLGACESEVAREESRPGKLADAGGRPP
jgi:uncharacterized protein